MEELINEIIEQAKYDKPSVGEEDACNNRIFVSAHKVAEKHGLDTEKLNVPDWVHKKLYN